jgi:OOP family OmpA-OmpF porin
MRKHILAGLASALALVTLPAVAADNGIYLGASVGQSGLEIDDFDYDADATGYKLIAGWRFIDWLAVEANYLDFGSGDDTVSGTKIETEADGISLSAVGFLPIGPVDLFARVGAVDWSADISSSEFGSGSDDGTDLTYGVGAQFRVWSLGIRAEYEMFDVSDADLSMISVGVTWTFL